MEHCQNWANTYIVKTGHIIEVKTLSRRHECRIRMIDKDHYILVHDDTGEVFEVEHTETRADNIRSVRASIARTRQLVNANFVGDPEREIWITVTYRENVQDPERVYRDWKECIRRLRRIYSDLEYIAVIEPQARGAWHLHVFMKRAGGAGLRLTKRQLREAWGQGQQVGIERIRDVDNLGAYLSAYLTNVPVQEGARGEKVKAKGIKKGERLKWYPPGINYYRFSKGIVQPEVQQMTEREAEEMLHGLNPVYDQTRDIVIRTPLGEDLHVQTIRTRQFNLRRE